METQWSFSTMALTPNAQSVQNHTNAKNLWYEFYAITYFTAGVGTTTCYRQHQTTDAPIAVAQLM
jgi:hypothetical protein